uniref:exodeoxyribonuclease III n=1 Tax=Leptobrachium leishanense TaxID=445787 RepID=A0A8C5PMS6_9ANUR
MASSVKTFVFMDLEATGVNKDLPKITEICLVAVHVYSLENPTTDDSGKVKLPRVLDKLCLCVDPGKEITPKASEITHLSNESLEDNEKKVFNYDLVSLINGFLSRQAQPVCLVAHNGFFYDFPLLKTELQQQETDLSSSLICLDSLQALRKLDRQENGSNNPIKGYYSLPELYRRAFGKEPVDCHYAEGDVLTLIMVFLSKATAILETVSTYCKRHRGVQLASPA